MHSKQGLQGEAGSAEPKPRPVAEVVTEESGYSTPPRMHKAAWCSWPQAWKLPTTQVHRDATGVEHLEYAPPSS